MMAEESAIIPKSDNPKQVSIATTLIPWRKDDDRARYMGYLACGFHPEEALYVLGLTIEWLEEQRRDESFSAIELKIPEIRKELSKEYIELDFFRNFRLVLEKDYRILTKSIQTDVVLNKQEHEYLLKLRSAYSPQQLAVLEQVMKGIGAEDFNFMKYVATHQNQIREVSRTTDKITFDSNVQGKEGQDNLEQG